MKISIMLMVIAISLIGYCETKTLKDLKLGDEVVTSVTNMVIVDRVWKTFNNGVDVTNEWKVNIDSIGDSSDYFDYQVVVQRNNDSLVTASFRIEKGQQIPQKIEWKNAFDKTTSDGDTSIFDNLESQCVEIKKNEYGFMLEDSFKEKFKDIELSDESSATIKELHNVLYSILIMLKN